MGLLDQITGAVDERKRYYGNIVRGLLDNPAAQLEMLRAQNAENVREQARAAQETRSVMPQVAEPAQRAAFDQAMNIGLLGTTTLKYGISHRPMNESGGAARLHDLTKSFPDDIYKAKDALRNYGSGDPREADVLRTMHSVRNKPDAEVTIYRGIPKGEQAKINPGDWVTLSKSVAKDYGDQVVSMKVKASQITSWADSLLEFGYYP